MSQGVTKVKTWLTQESQAPRWLVIGMMILSVVAFLAVQVKVRDLHLRQTWAEHELAEFTCDREDFTPVCTITYLPPPPIATITTFSEIQLGLVCMICSILGGVWSLKRNRK